MAAEDRDGRVAGSFCSRRDRIEIAPVHPNMEQLRKDLTGHESGVRVGAWLEVPAHVPRSLSATTAWALAETP